MGAQTYDQLGQELIEMACIDQEMRAKAAQDMNQWDDSVDKRNAARLKEIIDQVGWPTISKVGYDASQAAWLLVQHAYAEPEFMQHCLELMKQADEGDVTPANIAFLEDRLLTMAGEPQIYGTQFRNDGNGWKPFPIADPEHVDERRATIGLGTLAENEAQIKARYK